MITFVSLISYTQRGEERIRETVQRAQAFRETAQALGAEVKEVYWTMGNYDGVLIFEAPDDETATALMLKLTSLGNVRTETLRAFNSDQLNSILNRLD